MDVNNGVLLQWQFSTKNLDLTTNSTFTFPISYQQDYALFGVGFYISGLGRQKITSKKLSGFYTQSEVKDCGTQSWLAIGN